MTIKEMEERLGMTRANIRFYEREGFITPVRGENNYRWYTREDAATLEKVKLLRQLGLPLDTIRRAQRGELSLSDALAGRERELEAQRAGLARAEEICRAMRREGAEFAHPGRGGLPAPSGQPRRGGLPPVPGAGRPAYGEPPLAALFSPARWIRACTACSGRPCVCWGCGGTRRDWGALC